MTIDQTIFHPNVENMVIERHSGVLIAQYNLIANAQSDNIVRKYGVQLGFRIIIVAKVVIAERLFCNMRVDTFMVRFTMSVTMAMMIDMQNFMIVILIMICLND